MKIFARLLPITLLVAILASCGKSNTPSGSDTAKQQKTAGVSPTNTPPMRQLPPMDSAATIEVRINNTLGAYLVQFHYDAKRRLVDTITILQDKKVIQQITDLEMEQGTVAETDAPAAYFSLKDLNFDGALDIQILTSAGATRKFTYRLFDSATGTFVIDRTLADETGSAWLDTKDSSVMFHTNDGCNGMCYTRSTYRYNDSTRAFVLVHQETQVSVSGARKRKGGKTQGVSDGSGKFVRTIREIKGGKLQVVSRKTLNGSDAQ